MPTPRLSSRGKEVLPKQVREANGWAPGQEFEIVDANDGILLRSRSPFPQTTFEEVQGVTGYEGPRVSTEQSAGKEALRRKKLSE